ncbi:MAG: hypothetical protein PHO37_15450 [Kiritimatiellae bacterium]|nr:hypothetical protein [Kiritimatiellia bacterium]
MNDSSTKFTNSSSSFLSVNACVTFCRASGNNVHAVVETVIILQPFRVIVLSLCSLRSLWFQIPLRIVFFYFQRPSSPAAMERSGIAVRCSALLCLLLSDFFNVGVILVPELL